MNERDALLADYDAEAKGTRATLERVPVHLSTFKPHDKSMRMGQLAMHVATIPHFGYTILSTDRLDLATTPFPSLAFESPEATVRLFDETSRELRAYLAALPDEQLDDHWVLAAGSRVFREGPRGRLFRSLFLHHLIHHRAQLGVYLRLNDLPVPALYGPSADDDMSASHC